MCKNSDIEQLEILDTGKSNLCFFIIYLNIILYYIFFIYLLFFFCVKTVLKPIVYNNNKEIK